jgi:hypothetical protein
LVRGLNLYSIRTPVIFWIYLFTFVISHPRGNTLKRTYFKVLSCKYFCSIPQSWLQGKCLIIRNINLNLLIFFKILIVQITFALWFLFYRLLWTKLQPVPTAFSLFIYPAKSQDLQRSDMPSCIWLTWLVQSELQRLEWGACF